MVTLVKRNGAAPAITREQAMALLKPYLGADLRPLADQYGVTVWKNGRKNKGWAGMVIEQLLGRRQDTSRHPISEPGS